MTVSNRLRILVVDDHPGVGKAVCRSLAFEHDVVGHLLDATTLVEAIELLTPQVLLLDVNLPQIDGLTACRRIRELYPDLKIIVFTVADDADTRRRAFDAGASAFINKFSDVEFMLKAIEDVWSTANHIHTTAL
jgi:DNA-binding NarL/FixJ family response regulator